MMFQVEWLMLVVAGGVFILLGVGAYFWGRSEERSYYMSLAQRPDMREYLEHWPSRPEPQSLKIGGRIAITLGLIMAAVGGGVWLWG